MYKRKSLFITFEGIEGSGKSYQSQRLYKNLKKINIPVIFTREPGGFSSSEIIRKILLTGHKDKFLPTTDTLLYLAARNEHIEKKIKPAISNGKIIICDRFIDSTIAYQVYGKRVNKNLIDVIHKHILNNIKPDITFFLKVNINIAMHRLNKRKIKNRYDKFSKNFYANVQKAFVKISKKNRNRYVILDNSKDNTLIEAEIYNKIKKALN